MPYTVTQPTCHKRKPYCSLRKCYGGHSTEECSLRQKHHQEKLSKQAYPAKSEAKDGKLKKINSSLHHELQVNGLV
ncbi:hypothetical protein NEAUS06_2089 [Nematocida ausubeli]|nr:hypothetical protein NEAUS06_2089 [Nematocida ausubeli]